MQFYLRVQYFFQNSTNGWICIIEILDSVCIEGESGSKDYNIWLPRLLWKKMTVNLDLLLCSPFIPQLWKLTVTNSKAGTGWRPCLIWFDEVKGSYSDPYGAPVTGLFERWCQNHHRRPQTRRGCPSAPNHILFLCNSVKHQHQSPLPIGNIFKMAATKLGKATFWRITLRIFSSTADPAG